MDGKSAAKPSPAPAGEARATFIAVLIAGHFIASLIFVPDSWESLMRVSKPKALGDPSNLILWGYLYLFNMVLIMVLERTRPLDATMAVCVTMGLTGACLSSWALLLNYSRSVALTWISPIGWMPYLLQHSLRRWRNIMNKPKPTRGHQSDRGTSYSPPNMVIDEDGRETRSSNNGQDTTLVISPPISEGVQSDTAASSMEPPKTQPSRHEQVRQFVIKLLPYLGIHFLAFLFNITSLMLHKPKTPSQKREDSQDYSLALFITLWLELVTGHDLYVGLRRFDSRFKACTDFGVNGGWVATAFKFMICGELLPSFSWFLPAFWVFFSVEFRFGVNERVVNWLAGVLDR
ncbi:uncharacterized protein B0I36DRAFT_321631 [Microdochium trichocladiopsis]|uniref:Uncharacterized protein n=1 Tax=Microdochium trichocladiopsis TaxID=1682393 RepID=A0A9P8Y9N0_9PEZI|nr:uncharacterized protein B0I36DRAFT_321631 [Microdochium trichocladiopsis]KAH7033528.1 hypothetical protein B0I36DRAFT_321631 [Microdochium trichocladiopsis]